jgi:hypothetical protein
MKDDSFSAPRPKGKPNRFPKFGRIVHPVQVFSAFFRRLGFRGLGFKFRSAFNLRRASLGSPCRNTATSRHNPFHTPMRPVQETTGVLASGRQG